MSAPLVLKDADERWRQIILEWFGLWSQVAQLAADAQAEAIYGPCALCWGMGV